MNTEIKDGKLVIASPFSEAQIRDVVRSAEAARQPGQDAKVALVDAALHALAETWAARFANVHEMADMMGQSFAEALAADVGPDPEKIMGAEMFAKAAHGAHAVAAGFVQHAAPIAANRGRWLAKLGIVKEHIDALGAPAEPVAAPEPATEVVTAPLAGAASDEVTDPDLREMLGLPPLAVVEAPPFAPPAGSAAGAAALPPLSVPAAPSAAPGSSPPPPVTGDPREAFIILRSATEVDDKALAELLGISRSTVHNYLSGRTTRVKVTHAQARALVAEIDVRVARLREAADIFASVPG